MEAFLCKRHFRVADRFPITDFLKLVRFWYERRLLTDIFRCIDQIHIPHELGIVEEIQVAWINIPTGENLLYTLPKHYHIINRNKGSSKRLPSESPSGFYFGDPFFFPKSGLTDFQE